MAKKSFSENLTKIILLITLVPVIIGSICLSFYLEKQNTLAMIEDRQRTMQEQVQSVLNTVDLFYKLKSTFVSDNIVSNFLVKGSEYSLVETSDFLHTQTSKIEQIKFLFPPIYGIQIFSAQRDLPERWPSFFSEERLQEQSFDSAWQFNYVSLAMPTFLPSQELSVCLTQELKEGKKHVGYLQISSKMEDFFPFVYTVHNNIIRNYLFYDDELIEDNMNLSAKKSLSMDQLNRIYDKIKIAENDIKKTNNPIKIDNHIVVWQKIPNLDVYYISDCDLKAKYVYGAFVLLGAIIVICCMIIIVYFITKATAGKMLQDLNYLLIGLQKVQNGDLDVQIPVRGTAELRDTAISFNKTVKLLKKLVEDIKLEQQLVTETEIKAMQNQINAHFLYNVLETIRMQAELADQSSIVESITIISHMLRYCLHWKEVYVTLDKELNYVRSYISILNIRNDYQIDLVISIPEELQQCVIGKMLVQPIVENAFMHGIENRGVDSQIEISSQIDVDNKLLWLNIRDYGVGMYPSDLKNVQKTLFDFKENSNEKHGIGLQNIQQRLTVFYGPDYKLRIYSVPNLGTLVQIPIPYTVMFEE